ncbi:nitrilase [Micrococcales bacterium 31B]|nr:nitrilase [Micrococcales bacterium 31B]
MQNQLSPPPAGATLHLFVLQARAHSRDPAANLDCIAAAASRCRDAAASEFGEAPRVLVTPELFVSNYDPPSLEGSFGPAESDAAVARLRDIARTSGVALVASLPLFNAGARHIGAVFVPPDDANQEVRYLKTHLFGDEKLFFTPGTDAPPVFAYAGFTLSLMVCFDVEFPEMVRHVALRGADIVLVPTALMHPFDEPSQLLLPARAFENHVAIAYANHVGAPSPDLPLIGDSVIVGPDGRALARGPRWEPTPGASETPTDPAEALLHATVARADLDRSRAAFSYLTERRPDAYRHWGEQTVPHQPAATRPEENP